MHRRQLVNAIRRGLAARARERLAEPAWRRGAEPARLERREAGAPEGADDARLDALRGELVRELDRLAAADEACSADFRRVA
jgi:hypothetical protein